MKLLFLDTETTGVDPMKNGIIQIAGIIDINGQVVEEFNLRCKPFPGQLFTAEALRITGKTVEEIRTFPEPKEAYQKIKAIFDKYINRYDKNDKFTMVGQNTKFDYDFMTTFFQNNYDKYFYAYVAYHLVDLVNASALFKMAGKISMPNMKLETMAKLFGIPLAAHDALEDIRATRQILYKFVECLKTIPDELLSPKEVAA